MIPAGTVACVYDRNDSIKRLRRRAGKHRLPLQLISGSQKQRWAKHKHLLLTVLSSSCQYQHITSKCPKNLSQHSSFGRHVLNKANVNLSEPLCSYATASLSIDPVRLNNCWPGTPQRTPDETLSVFLHPAFCNFPLLQSAGNYKAIAL